MVLPVCALLLGSCARHPLECTAESARQPVFDILRDRLEKAVSARLKGDDGSRLVGLSRIHGAVAGLGLTLDDLRTSRVEQGSILSYCAGTLHLRFPAAMLNDAAAARQATGLGTVDDLADTDLVDRHGGTYSTTIDFNVQPTDDGGKIIAELTNPRHLLDFGAEVIASALVRPQVEEQQRRMREIAEAEATAQMQQAAEQRAANLDEARAENQVAMQDVDGAWNALSPEQRARLLPLQRAWIRKKDADCLVEAAAISAEPADREMARLACDTRAQRERIRWLRQQRGPGGIWRLVPRWLRPGGGNAAPMEN